MVGLMRMLCAAVKVVGETEGDRQLDVRERSVSRLSFLFLVASFPQTLWSQRVACVELSRVTSLWTVSDARHTEGPSQRATAAGEFEEGEEAA